MNGETRQQILDLCLGQAEWDKKNQELLQAAHRRSKMQRFLEYLLKACAHPI